MHAVGRDGSGHGGDRSHESVVHGVINSGR